MKDIPIEKTNSCSPRRHVFRSPPQPVPPRRAPSSSQASPRPALHRAKVVLPITHPPIENGAVAVAQNIILDVGPFPLLRRQWPEASVCEYGEVAILPALVNAHAHLDLSGLAGRVRPHGGMADWIRSLLATREQVNGTQQERARAQALVSMRSVGTGIIGDINSSADGLEENTHAELIIQTFLEVFGLQAENLDTALNRLPATAQTILANSREDVSLAVHAPYTASASLLREVKAWGSTRGKIVSIHAAESADETLFLHTGRGPLRDLLEERGMEPHRWKPPGCGAVTYLDRLGFLDSRSLCVHVVKVNEGEITLLRRSGAGVCLCPRSNLFIGHGLPPVTQLLAVGISCALGTDSLASNADLNLFREIAVLTDRCGVKADTAISMATIHGARNLGLAERYGSLEKGKRWLSLKVEATDPEAIIATGCEGAIEWLT